MDASRSMMQVASQSMEVYKQSQRRHHIPAIHTHIPATRIEHQHWSESEGGRLMTVDDERVLMLRALRKGVAPAQLCSVGGVVMRIRLRCQHCSAAQTAIARSQRPSEMSLVGTRNLMPVPRGENLRAEFSRC